MDFSFENMKKSGGHVVCSWTVPDDHPVLNGHFPGQPILPGVAQVQSIIELVRQCFAPDARIRALHRCKFTAPLIPGNTARIQLKQIENNTYTWTIDCGRTRVSRGQFMIDHGTAPC